MPRRTSAELVLATRKALDAASASLAEGDVEAAAESARAAFKTARAQRSHRLISEAWVALLETLAAANQSHTEEYRELVEGAFAWAETMPEEIQVWFFVALMPHLSDLGLERLIDRGSKRVERATAWLARGGKNVQVRLKEFHLQDLANGRPISAVALALEREGAYLAEELHDPEAVGLTAAANAWREAGRPDRAAFVEEMAASVRSR